MITMSQHEFARHLKELAITSRAAAIALGVSQRQVFYYLSGESPVPDTVAILLRTKRALLEALAALQELDPEWLNKDRLNKDREGLRAGSKRAVGRYHGLVHPRAAHARTSAP